MTEGMVGGGPGFLSDPVRTMIVLQEPVTVSADPSASVPAGRT